MIFVLIALMMFAAVILFINTGTSMYDESRIIRKRLVTTGETKKKSYVFLPVLKLFAPVNKFLMRGKRRDKITHLLATAGVILKPEEYYAFYEIVIMLCLAVALALPAMYPRNQLVPYGAWVVVLLGFVVPGHWLKKRKKRRQFLIARALPTMIDLLILCVDAGMDFMIAVHKVIQRSKPSPLIDELYEMWHRTKMGVSRKDSLKEMAWRIDLAEINSFVRTLVQADRMGVPVGVALRQQADEVRFRRFQRAENLALRAPIKMLFPLLFCILPVVLIIVGAPVILEFLRSGFLHYLK
jgi:tight adherence protein C